MHVPISKISFLVLLIWCSSTVYGATYTVTNTNNAGAGSFRQAILDANSNAGADVIEFNIPAAGVQTIALSSLLPTITGSVTIDGRMQGGIGYTGAPLIVINGSGFTPRDNGLYLNATNCVVRGFIIQGFDVGIRIEQANNEVYGNYIGTNAAGIAAAGNSKGIYISSSANTIGGGNATMRNIISGNAGFGIHLYSSGATDNKIQGNFVGTNVSGTAALANASFGIALENSSSNFIGTNSNGIDDATEGNLVSGNNNHGILLVSNSNNNTIAGNMIGTNIGGTAKIGNTFYGIVISGSNSNQIGGGLAVQRNIISGNRYGVYIDNNSSYTKIQGNYIGTDITGTAALGNTYYGIYTVNITYTTFGTDADGVNDATEGNLISGNGFTAIHLFRNCNYNTIAGNLMGTDKNGTSVIRNGLSNLYLNEANNNQIGGGLAVQRNVISNSAVHGIYIENSALTNKIQGNYIGTDITGTIDLGNLQHGIWMFNNLSNVIVGTDGDGINDAAEGNLISGNNIHGIYLEGYANSNTIAGNKIGTDISGTGVLPNSNCGIYIKTSSNNLIGGTGIYSANIIAFNTQKGVSIESGTQNALRRNMIYSNGGMAIDLGNNGVTVNDTDDADAGANNLQNFPVINSHEWTPSSVRLIGVLNSEANKTYTIEFFYSPTLGPSSTGAAMNYLATTTVVTDALGSAGFDVTFATAVPVGYFITSTATDPSNNTSELSASLIPLPVTLLAFEANTKDNDVLLEWEVIDEKNLSGYTIEFSPEGFVFDSIGFVVSKGRTSYGFIHRDIATSGYYRLKIIDNDGSFVYSPLKFVNRKEYVNVSVFPNPARESVSIVMQNSPSHNIGLSITDLSGKIVYESILENNQNLFFHKINIEKLDAGIYLISLTSDNGENIFKKFCIE